MPGIAIRDFFTDRLLGTPKELLRDYSLLGPPVGLG